MEQEPVYYQPPEAHQDHIKKMAWGLGIFFSALFLVLLILIIFAHKLATYLPFSAEKRFVKPYEVMADKWLSDKLGSPRVEDYLQNLTDGLTEHMDLRADIQISVHYVDSPIENAFATIGGHIFVFRGLLKSVDNENALAMILAHEAAHIKHRDPVVAMGRGAALQMMYAFVTGDSLADVGGELGILFFSREQEEKADIAAIKTLNRYYGHVHGYDQFFTAMKDTMDDSSEVPEWLSSHPNLQARVDYLNELVEENNFKLGMPTSYPEEIQAQIEKPLTETSEL